MTGGGAATLAMLQRLVSGVTMSQPGGDASVRVDRSAPGTSLAAWRGPTLDDMCRRQMECSARRAPMHQSLEFGIRMNCLCGPEMAAVSRDCRDARARSRLSHHNVRRESWHGHVLAASQHHRRVRSAPTDASRHGHRHHLSSHRRAPIGVVQHGEPGRVGHHRRNQPNRFRVRVGLDSAFTSHDRSAGASPPFREQISRGVMRRLR